MGGKGYKSYTSLTGKKVSGDWEDSDRGAGNRATRRAGGKVKAKSPTYLAHVHNKGKKKVDPEKNPAVKEHHQTDANGKVIEHGDGTPSSVEEKFIGEVNTENENPNANEKKIDVMKGKNKIKINPNVGEQVEPNKINDTNSKDPVIDRKEKRVSMMKRQILQKKMQAVRSGAGADIVAHNEPRGKVIKDDAQYGYDKEGNSLNPKDKKKKEEQEDPRSMGTKYRNIKNRLRSMGVKFVGPASRLEEEDKAYQYVVSKLKKKYGDGVLTKRDKIKQPTPAQKKAAAAHQAKVDRENAAERAKDPSQGRYPPGYSNRGSD